MVVEVPTWLQPSSGDPDITYTAQQLRTQLDIMSFLSGVTLQNDLKVTQRGAGANMSVDVAAGSAIVPGLTVSNQGKYACRSTATVNVTIGAAPGSGTRTDLVVARVYDNQADGLTLYKWQPEVFSAGTVPTGASYIPLASVAVASGSVSVLTANITDKRLLNTMGDVPAFVMTGGDSQNVANNANTRYQGSGSFSTLIGCDTTGNVGEIKIRQQGRYHCTWTQRIGVGGNQTTERMGFIQRTRSGATRRVGSQAIYPGTGESAPGSVFTASGTTFCLPGDLLAAYTYQFSTVALHLVDDFTELLFAGYWVGP